MVTVDPEPSVYQIIRNPAAAHWFIRDSTIRNSYLNVFFSLLGYILFAVILRTSYSRGVLRNHIHDIFLILIFACFTDVVELRMHLQIIFDLQDRAEFIGVGAYKFIPTSVGICTMVTYLYYAHRWITYVEAIVSIYRFIVRFCGKNLPISYVYKAIGTVFTLKASFILATFVFGEPMTTWIYCTRAYFINTPMMISGLVWWVTILIAPILSTLMIIKGFVRRQHDAGTSVFILLSSLSMAAFGWSYLLHGFAEQQEWIRPVIMAIWWMHEFRFFLLCILAIFVVDDIRDSVIASICGSIRKLFGLQETHPSIANDVFLPGIESKKESEFETRKLPDLMLI